jgi:FtsP/CotA-like multicopper oxidase with cupredoxin domain
MAPDGFARPVMVVNGQIPGPTIVADWGDILEITVTSHLTTNGTGLHWVLISQEDISAFR